MIDPAHGSELADWLQARGYARVPLVRTATGHFHTQGELNGFRAEVMIDTGASSTVVDVAFAEAAGCLSSASGRHGGGAGGVELAVQVLQQGRLCLADLQVTPPVLHSMDLSHVGAALAVHGAPAPQVVVGADILGPRRAVIDYASSSLFLAPPGDISPSD